MPTVRERYDDLLRSAVAPTLRAAAFKKRRNTFSRQHPGGWELIDFQASQFGTRDAVSFTINLGLAFTELLGVTDGPPMLGRAHIRERIGRLLEDGQDRWWDLRSDSDYSVVGADVVAALTDTALPWLRQRATLAQVLAGVRSRPAEFLERWHLARLAVLLERSDRPAEALELREIAQLLEDAHD